MSRAIKYRIWNNDIQKYLKPDQTGTHCYSNLMIDPFTGLLYDFVGGISDELCTKNLLQDYYVYFKESYDGPKLGIKKPKYVVEQFTGLTDKNGAEMYEGDIIAVPTGTIKETRKEILEDGSEETTYISQPPENYLVSNLGHAFFVGTPEKPDYCGVLNYGMRRMAYDVAVVGNIHQNSELIKEKIE